ncbi:MAG TPA: L,D-transpeptidase [Acidimicrobiales bacterium]|nr:L,D-transpeptidase [Acidimicrobiales bacterium]
MTDRIRRARLPLLILSVLLLLASGCGSGTSTLKASQRARNAGLRSQARAVSGLKAPEVRANTPGSSPLYGPAYTLVATTHGAIPGFAEPGGEETSTVPGSWFGAPSVLPVIERSPGWVKVRLAQRPNGSTAWVLSSDVTLASSPYRIVIELGTTRLYLLKSGRVIFSAPVGVGTSQYPTPTGDYFLALFAAPPNPGYGAFVMVTSDHSDTITDWDESGDAIVAIHGPLGSDSQIGTSGARVSHGCIRLHNADLDQLRVVPVGSPIDIVAA